MLDPEDAVAFLQDLMVGKQVYDRMDPGHLRQLSGACQLVDDYALITRLVPELSQKLAGLKATKDGASAEAIERRHELLEELREALAVRSQRLASDLAELEAEAEAAVEAEADDYWVWGDPKVKPFDGVVAIDLGNTNVVCSHWNFQAADPEVSSTEPVAVNVLDAKGFHKLTTGSYKVGEKALKHRKQINLYQSFRRWLGTQHKPRPAITGSQMTPVVVADLVGALIKHALQTLTGQVSPGGEPMRFPNVVVTVPASGDAAFEYELRRVFDRLRIQGSAELDEATAAGVYTLLKPVLLREYKSDEQLTPGQWYAKTYGMEFDGVQGSMDVLCVDVGGGTTDLSLLQFSILEDSRACRPTVEVMATSGFQDLSGEGLTLYLFDLLKRRLALALADPRRAIGGEAAAEEGAHPWLEFHSLEAGAKAMYVPQHLEEDMARVTNAWDVVAAREPLDDTLKAAVDTLFPTITKSAARVGKKVRRVNFNFLWGEAERLKREISAKRAAGDEGAVLARLNLRAAKRQAKTPYADKLIRDAGQDPAKPAVPGALCVTSGDIDAFVAAKGEQVFSAIKDMAEGRRVRRVLFAGNGASDVRFALSRFLTAALDVTDEQIEFDPAQAKSSVSKGACLWAIGNRLEGFNVAILRRPRHPSTLNLVSAVRNDELFKRGGLINRFSYVQPAAREGEDGSKLVQVDRLVGGQLKPFMMFRPAKDGRLLSSIDDLPIKRRADVELPDVNTFLEGTQTGTLVDFQAKDPNQYLQTAVEWISNWEILEKLRKEMSLEEVIAWIESLERLQQEPPVGSAFHRYYMDETRELYLVYHAKGKKLLVPGEVTESARRQLPEELDPFSGVH